MTSSQDNVSMAVFCDFENVALGVRDAQYEKFDIKLVLERLLLKGSIVVKKAYCDWERYKNFKATMHEANFELIEIPHVRQSGKNSADIRLVVDALDLCYTKSHVDTFVIVSGDSDFSPLVSKLRENAKKVIGVGVKQSTSDLLIANCDEFIFYDDLVREIQRAAAKRETRAVQAAPARRTRDDEPARKRRDDADTRRTTAVEIVAETFEALVAERGDSGKIWASVLKEAIKRRKPDFNESYYGFRAFGNLLDEAQSRGLLEVGRDDKSGTFVYRGNGVGASASGALMEAPSQGELQGARGGQGGQGAQVASDESPARGESRRRGRGSRRNERRDDSDTPGLFEDGGDAMAANFVSHDLTEPVVDKPVGSGHPLPDVRFDAEALKAAARSRDDADDGFMDDPFEDRRHARGGDARSEPVQSDYRFADDDDELDGGEADRTPMPGEPGNRTPSGDAGADDGGMEGAGRDDAGTDDPRMDNAATHAAPAGDALTGDDLTGDALSGDAGSDNAAVAPSGNRRPSRGRRKAGAAGRSTADQTLFDVGAPNATAPNAAAPEASASATAPAFSQADPDVSGGAAGVRLGMDESPAPVGRRPGRAAQRRRNDAETTPSSDASSTPGMPESADSVAGAASVAAPEGRADATDAAGAAPAAGFGGNGDAAGDTLGGATAASAGATKSADNPGDTAAPTKRAAKSARKSPRPVPARSRLPRKPKEG